MSSRHKPKLNISPVLFETEQGEPLCFYLRPGPVKGELKPLIEGSGGLLCNVQKPGTILLKDPEEKASVTETTTHWYVSTKYIHDCIEKNERLNIEDYRLNPESTNSTKLKSKVGSPGFSGGRHAYSAEEDEAILRYVSTRVKEIGGNKLWQEMDKRKVTSHTWQSMKYRYKVQLAHRLPEYKQAEADTEKENKKQDTEQSEAEHDNEENSSAERISGELEEPGNRSSEMVLTQISPSDEQADVPQVERNDSETCELMETSKSEIDETPEQQQPASPQPEIASSHKGDQPEATTKATSAPNLKDESSQNSVNRPVTRQQFELENMPYVKRLRSSGTPPESPLTLSQKLSGKAKSYSSPKSDPGEAQAPPRKVRRKTGANVVEQIEEEESEPNGSSEQTHSDQVTCPASPQPTKKKAEKRKLGILEMATKEFEDDSESESDGQYETPRPSKSIEAVIVTSSNPDPTTLQSENQTVQADQEPPPTTVTTTAAASTTTTTTTTPANPAALSTSDPAVPEVTTGANPPVEDVTSKAHLFIFESESQELEEDSQSLIAGPSTSAAGQTSANKNAKTPSLTQDQLEEDVQLLKALMKETNQDLVTVTKAILRASGDLILSRELLLNRSSFFGPIWTWTEDQRLISGEQTARQELLNKYGEEGVAKRLMFLEFYVRKA